MKDMIDVCCGRMSLKSVNREIIHYMTQYPTIKRLVVDIKRQKPRYGKEGGYYTTIYMTKKDFNGG